jgi:hypothetical protein
MDGFDTTLYYRPHSTNNKFEVWTPDMHGACIGVGDTAEQARINAVINMLSTAVNIIEKPPEVVEL